MPREGLDFRTIEVSGLPRKLSLAVLSWPFSFARGLCGSRRILRDFRPDVVVGLGGFVSAPMVLAARAHGVPTLIHEQNSVVGVANRWTGRVADAIAVTYPGTDRAFPGRQVRLVGNPVRPSIFAAASPGARSRFELVEDRKTLLIFGGSRGAANINDAVIEGLPAAANEAWLQIVHVTGKMDFGRVEAETKRLGLDGRKLLYRCVPYVDEMGEAYSVADLVVARAGATTIAETTALGLGTILVPYPYATANHQEKNARFVEQAGAARVILDRALDGAALFGAATEILCNPGLLASMRASAREFGRPNAAEELADMVSDLVKD